MKTDLTRRGFFKLVAGAASLITVPAPAFALPIIYGDGVHCDADGIEALLQGEEVEFRKINDANYIGCRGDKELSFGNVKMHCWRTFNISMLNNIDIKHMNIQFHGDHMGVLFRILDCENVRLLDSTFSSSKLPANHISEWQD